MSFLQRHVRHVRCVRNAEYRVSLIRGKIYVAIPDAAGHKQGMIRVIDESGEKNLFPGSCFAEVDVATIARALGVITNPAVSRKGDTRR